MYQIMDRSNNLLPSPPSKLEITEIWKGGVALAKSKFGTRFLSIQMN